VRAHSALSALVIAAGLASARAASADEVPFDLRSPVRAGFAYTGVTKGPALDFSWGVEVELWRLTRRLSLHALADFDSVTRLDLPSEQANSSIGGMGAGAGLFYLTDGGVAFGLDVVAYATFDQHDFVGGGLGAHAYLYPFYQRAEDSIRHRGGLLASYVESAISIWVFARADWTDVGNGGTLAAGVAIDLVRAFLLPYVDLLAGRWRKTAPPAD